MSQTISQKIDAYAQSHFQELKKKQGLRTFTKLDIASIMVQSGALSKTEFDNWRSSSEGFSAGNPSGSVFGRGFAYQPSYLDQMASFSSLSPEEQIIQSHKGPHFGETRNQRLERESNARQVAQNTMNRGRVLNTPTYQQVEGARRILANLPNSNASFTEVLRNEKFSKMNENEKIEYLAQVTGKKLDAAIKSGDIMPAITEFLSLMEQVPDILDVKTGYKNVRDGKRELYRTFLNKMIEKMGGDPKHLNAAAKVLVGIEAAIEVSDDLASPKSLTELASFATLFFGGEALAAKYGAKAIKAFNLVKAGGGLAMMFQGGKELFNGGQEFLSADTTDEAIDGAKKALLGLLSFSGGVGLAANGAGGVKSAPKANAPKATPKANREVRFTADGRISKIISREASGNVTETNFGPTYSRYYRPGELGSPTSRIFKDPNGNIIAFEEYDYQGCMRTVTRKDANGISLWRRNDVYGESEYQSFFDYQRDIEVTMEPDGYYVKQRGMSKTKIPHPPLVED